MANLKEDNTWEQGIYQFETSDPVMGGPNGIDNVPTRQLANRTLWLKNQLAAAEQSADVPLGTMADDLSAALLTEGGALRYAPDDFLRHAPAAYRGIISALMGAIIAAAHNCSFILLDDRTVDLVARYTERLCPAVRPYLLHPRALLLTGETLPGGITACLTAIIVEASLTMLNEMKTFAEAGVSVAADGAGVGRQHRAEQGE